MSEADGQKPTPDFTEADLLDIIYDARVKSLLLLKAKVEAGGASASDYTALMKAATEVEAMAAERATTRPNQPAPTIPSDDYQEATEGFAEDDLGEYDPTAPLYN